MVHVGTNTGTVELPFRRITTITRNLWKYAGSAVLATEHSTEFLLRFEPTAFRGQMPA